MDIGKTRPSWEQDDGLDSDDEARSRSRSLMPKRKASQNVDVDNEQDDASLSNSENESESSSSDRQGIAEGNGFAQYLDSDDEAAEGESELASSEDDESEPDEEEFQVTKADGRGRPQTEEGGIRKKMEKVPFATLLKARTAMRHAGGGSDDDDEGGSSGGSSAEGNEASTSAAKERRRLQRELEKRESKHAPTEMSSRKPISRRRNIVDAPSTQRRDPRFSSLSGSQVNAGIFANSYGFLRDQQSGEVGELRKIYKQLRRQEAHHAGPRAKSEVALKIRAERESIEQALRREEGRENERLKREREAAVLRSKKKEIDENVKKGGKRFYLKEADKKRLILEDKFKRLSGTAGSDGGPANAAPNKRGALQRAVERRRKKNAARDHRMPLGGGASGAGARFGFDSRDAMPPSAVPKRLRMTESGASTGNLGRARPDTSNSTSASSGPSQRGPRKRGRRG